MHFCYLLSKSSHVLFHLLSIRKIVFPKLYKFIVSTNEILGLVFLLRQFLVYFVLFDVKSIDLEGFVYSKN